MKSSRDQLSAARLVAHWLRESTYSVAFTGAGISTESGIPDFRSPGGVWAKYQPVYYDEFMSSPAARHEYWRQKSEAHRHFADAQPNIAHRVLADWESRSPALLHGVITQNIDGLHQLAGSRRVLELHGTARHVECQDCRHREDADALVGQFLRTDAVPDCPACTEGRMKHATVSFGQMLPESVLRKASEFSQSAALFLALGSSLVVTPAADLPRLAKQYGAKLLIVNRDPTPLDGLADLVVSDSIGDFMQCVANLV